MRDESLYTQDRERFCRVREEALDFRARYGGQMLREDVFSAMKNLARKNVKALELLFFPIRDKRLGAFSVVRKEEVFCAVNTELSLGEQIFSAAYELFFISRYIEGRDRSLLENGSMLLSGQEDLEALAFAGLVLAPDSEIVSRMELYDMERSRLGLAEVVQLTDCFGLPYEAMTERLYECGFFDRNRARIFLDRRNEAKQYMRDSGVGRRWLLKTREVCFGTLVALLKTREDEESWKLKERLEELKAFLRQE